jgi:hypothetical protein
MPTYIPRWIPISEALDHVDAVDLERALRDGAVAARSIDDFEPIDARKWSADIRWINGSKLLLGDGRVEFCRAQVEELARKTKGPIKAWVPATEAGLIAADEPGGANWRSVVPDPAYPIRESHTAYEWSIALGGEVHPYGDRIADRFGSRGDLRADTIADMKTRERAAEGWSGEARAIYEALKAQFKAGSLEPLRREWCNDPAHIDPPVLDFSRCSFGIEQVLQLIRHRRDTGKLIGELLAAQERAAATIPPEPDTIALALQDTRKIAGSAANGGAPDRKTVKRDRVEAQDEATNGNSLAEEKYPLPEGRAQAVSTPQISWSNDQTPPGIRSNESAAAKAIAAQADEPDESSASPEAHAQNVNDGANSTRRRTIYSACLERWIGDRDLKVLRNHTPNTLTKRFCAHCEQVEPAIFNDPSFPRKNLRGMEGLIRQIVEKRIQRVEARQVQRGQNNDI